MLSHIRCHLAFGLALIFSTSCSSVDLREENTFTRKANLVASKSHTGAWDYHEVVNGDSIAVHLHRSSFIKGSFDGSSYYYITFQLPKTAKTGDVFELNPIPSGRKHREVGEHTYVANMKDLEVTGFRYGNPAMGYMRDVQHAEVRIKAMSNQRAVIHLKLKAKLEPEFELDIDRDFKLKRKTPSRR